MKGLWARLQLLPWQTKLAIPFGAVGALLSMVGVLKDADVIWLVGFILPLLASQLIKNKQYYRILLAVALTVFVIRPLWMYVIAVDTIQVHVNRAERIPNASGNGAKYIVFCQEGEYEITDTVWYAQFLSSRIFAQFVPGRVYEIKVVGMRIGLLSLYPNIVDVNDSTR